MSELPRVCRRVQYEIRRLGRRLAARDERRLRCVDESNEALIPIGGRLKDALGFKRPETHAIEKRPAAFRRCSLAAHEDRTIDDANRASAIRQAPKHRLAWVVVLVLGADTPHEA